MPASLLAALADHWTDAGLDDAVAPLYCDEAPAGATYPFVLIDHVEEVLPGETADDTPVEVWVSVHATGKAEARAIARLAVAALDCGPHRNPLAWDTGSERFNERNTSTPDLSPSRGPEGDPVYKFRLHYTWWISGAY